MTPCCANSHMSVPLRVLTVRTSLYTYIYIDILTNIHSLYYRYFYMWTHVVRTHICLRPCECSQLEPLCIHRYTHKYTYFILQILWNVNPCCANSHMSVPLRVLALRTSLHTYICSQVYCTYSITDIFVYKLMLCKLTYVCALANAHTQNLFLYIPILTSIHISRIISRIRWYINPCCALSHLFVPLRVLTLRTSLHTDIHKY